MHRISVFLFVLISAVAGVLLIILPWTPEWTDNYLLLSFPCAPHRGVQRILSRHLQRPGPARYLDRFLGGAPLPRTPVAHPRINLRKAAECTQREPWVDKSEKVQAPLGRKKTGGVIQDSL